MYIYICIYIYVYIYMYICVVNFTRCSPRWVWLTIHHSSPLEDKKHNPAACST